MTSPNPPWRLKGREREEVIEAIHDSLLQEAGESGDAGADAEASSGALRLVAEAQLRRLEQTRGYRGWFVPSDQVPSKKERAADYLAYWSQVKEHNGWVRQPQRFGADPNYDRLAVRALVFQRGRLALEESVSELSVFVAAETVPAELRRAVEEALPALFYIHREIAGPPAANLVGMVHHKQDGGHLRSSIWFRDEDEPDVLIPPEHFTPPEDARAYGAWAEAFSASLGVTWQAATTRRHADWVYPVPHRSGPWPGVIQELIIARWVAMAKEAQGDPRHWTRRSERVESVIRYIVDDLGLTPDLINDKIVISTLNGFKRRRQ